MVCVEEYLVSVYTSSLLVSIVNQLTKPRITESRAQCLSVCYRNATCSMCVYDTRTHICYLNNRWIQNLTSVQKSTEIYYVFARTDSCNSKGYRFIRKGLMCLRVSTDKSTWVGAQQTCRSEGALLVKIKTQEKQDAIVELLQQDYAGMTFYIGAFIDVYGKWLWTDLSPLTFQNFLEDSELRNGYAAMDMAGTYGWYFEWSSSSHMYICEKE